MYWCVVCYSKPTQEHSEGFEAHLEKAFVQKAWGDYIHFIFHMQWIRLVSYDDLVNSLG